MTRTAIALLAAVLLAACSPEPTATASSTDAAPAAAQSQPVSRPAAQAAAQPRAQEEQQAPAAVQVAQADTAPASNARFVAGEHYRVLNPAQPTSVPPGKVEVVDVFWYGCGGCYILSPYMEAWHRSKPDVAEYVRMPAPLNPGWEPQARLYFATKALGIDDQTHAAIFNEYHVERNPLNTIDLMVEFLGRYDVPADQAREVLTSFSVDSELRAAKVRAGRYRLTFVPAVVVNGKYVISADQPGGPATVPAVINYLVGLEASGSN
jgi:thiol:disulfide interchange protein DsbA